MSLIICVVGIANGPVGMVFFYEKEVPIWEKSNLTANVKHFFTSLGKKIFTLYGKEFFTLFGKEVFT